MNPYISLAQRLDALPNGFPATADGAELRVLEKLFSPEDAELASQLRMTAETPAQIAARIGGDSNLLRKQLKDMVRRGLIGAARADSGLGYHLIPFVVGIYEMQAGRLDAELAQLFEAYYRQAFGQTLAVQPQVHRVIPVGKTVQMDNEVYPYESATAIVAGAQAWGVTDCVCRTQKALIGEACEHPIDVCMVLSSTPNAFASVSTIRALTQAEAMTTLRRAADAGLVHSVSNNQRGLWYICNCCTCSCGILRGMADLGIANVVARSAFVNQVDDEACIGCELCVARCQFDALTMEGVARVNETRCVGCGVCVLACDQDAMHLVRRPADQVLPPPITEGDWRGARAAARGIQLDSIV